MRPLILVLFAVATLANGCRKYDLDVATLVTNPFDADHTGTMFIRVDSITKYSHAGGALHQQWTHCTIDPRLLQADDFKLRYLESTIPDTILVPRDQIVNGRYVFRNFNVQPGTTYCYTLDVLVNGNQLVRHQVDTCAIVP